MRSPTRIVSCGLAVMCLTLGAAATASAQSQTTAIWNCRASAVELQIASNSRVAPILTDRTPCTDSSTGVPNVGPALGLAPSLTARTAFANTSAKPPVGFPKDQVVGAEAGVENLELRLFDGALTIGLDAARSSAGGQCNGGNPTFIGASTAANLMINGQPIMLDGLLSSIVDPISNGPLGRLVMVRLNEQIRTASGLTQRAAHVIVLEGAAGSNPLVDLVIAESKINSASACDPNAINNGGGGNAGDNVRLPQICPAGSSLDFGRGVCIIRAEDSGGQGIIVIGPPSTGPSGGTVISLVNARKRFNSVCLSGPGPRFATVGTNRRDRITGTNRPDRILGLGGNDALDGGRENDCVDGGTGGDNLSGALGNDRVFGMSGKDALNGGPGTDRLSGGSGNDTINAAFGQDVVSGGSGVDFINVATAGKPARVDCGPGRDKVRFNRNETRRVRNCETRIVFRER